MKQQFNYLFLKENQRDVILNIIQQHFHLDGIYIFCSSMCV